MEIFYHRLSNLLWGGIVLLLVVLAVYVSLGRLVTANLGAYQTAILQELNVRIPFNVEAERVSGEWHSFTPVIVLTGLRISVPDGPEAPLELTEGRVGLDVWNSLRTGSLQVTRLILDDLTLRGELGADGRFRLLGFGGGAGETDTWAREFLRNAEQVVLRRNLLRLGLPGGEVRELDLDLSLTRRGSRRSLEAKLGSTRGTDIAVLARGLGDPFEPGLFEGDLYLQVRTADLGAVKAMFAGGAPPVWAEGRVDAEFWLTWDRGVPSVEGRVEAGDLLVTPTGGGWQLPMQRVAFAASVARDREHWTLYASDVEVETDATALQLPRVQIDAWGRALRLRASEVALAPAASIAANLEALPESLREVIVALAPRGELSALQFSLGDFQRPADDWEVEANFEGLAVDSWRGAPGARSARGHVQLGAGGGEVIVDSEGLQLEFPGVYREPLHFDELHGTLHLDWDSSAVNLKSRLITAHGEEGRARALFALAIPLEPTATGIEMSLLVGLRDSHPTYRVKYVPYVLNQGLRDWLAASIGDGDIEEGAFLWRGSLKGSAGPLRTVQLAFNVTDTWLEYHEDWPGVTVEEGIVLIDDSRVSVWADRARVIDSAVENLSVETWLDSESRVALAVRGGISGPAADGLAVLNDSPLTDIVGGAFTDWSLEGGLETELALHLKLGDNPPPPVVDIDTRWRDVDLRIMPGNLPVESLNGEFSYSSENGFTSRALAGVLWGRTVNARLEQRHAGAAYDPSSSTVEVQVATDVAMSDVRDWLGLAPLGFASGEATASVGVRVAPGEAPVLTVASAVKEVALDLPDPWRKAPGTPADFRLEMPLGDAGAPMRLSLDDQLQLDLLLAGGELAGGSLGVRVEPTAVRDGVFHISGHAGLLQADQWLDFVAQYLGGGDLLSPPGGGAAADTAPDGDVSQVTGGGPPLNIVIERLFARELVFMDRNFGEGEVSLALDAAGWGLSVDADWLQGEMYVAADTAVPSRVEVAMLDLAGLPESAPGGEAPPEEPAQEPAPAPGWALPPLDVTLAQIVDGERSLGAVSFTLSGDGPLLNADNIRGELARVRLQESSPGQLTWPARRGGVHQPERTFRLRRYRGGARVLRVRTHCRDPRRRGSHGPEVAGFAGGLHAAHRWRLAGGGHGRGKFPQCPLRRRGSAAGCQHPQPCGYRAAAQPVPHVRVGYSLRQCHRRGLFPRGHHRGAPARYRGRIEFPLQRRLRRRQREPERGTGRDAAGGEKPALGCGAGGEPARRGWRLRREQDFRQADEPALLGGLPYRRFLGRPGGEFRPHLRRHLATGAHAARGGDRSRRGGTGAGCGSGNRRGRGRPARCERCAAGARRRWPSARAVRGLRQLPQVTEQLAAGGGRPALALLAPLLAQELAQVLPVRARPA